MVALTKSGPWGGLITPKKMAGRYYLPDHMQCMDSALTIATTGAQYYAAPFYVDEITAYAGGWCFNAGVGDNTKTAKIAIYSEASAGGPGALAKSFGSVTFTGAAALRTLASAWTPSTIGWHWLEFVTSAAVTMYSMTAVYNVSNAGYAMPNPKANALGWIGGPSPGATPSASAPGHDYVAGTYANFPESTALTLTATAGGNVLCPLFGLYK